MSARILSILSAVALTVTAVAAQAEGDVAKGEKIFKKCKACHTIKNGDEMIYKGGKVGPNLYGVVGRPAGSYEGYKYSKDMKAAGAAGLVWDEELISQFIKDPKKFLRAYLDNGKAKSKMSYKLKKGGDDVAAFLASVAK